MKQRKNHNDDERNTYERNKGREGMFGELNESMQQDSAASLDQLETYL